MDLRHVVYLVLAAVSSTTMIALGAGLLAVLVIQQRLVTPPNLIMQSLGDYAIVAYTAHPARCSRDPRCPQTDFIIAMRALDDNWLSGEVLTLTVPLQAAMPAERHDRSLIHN